MVSASSVTSGIAAYNNAVNRGANMAASALSPEKAAAPASQGYGFTELVKEALNQSMATGYNAESVQLKALAGKAEMHELVTAVSTAELTLQTVVAVRDKVINAYQDIIRMPI